MIKVDIVTGKFVISAFYQFVRLDDYQAMQGPMQDFCRAQGVRGSILMSDEGINGTIAGTRAGIDAVMAYLRADERLANLLHKESFADFRPFKRMKVRLKKEIVTIKRDDADPFKQVGTYVPPEEWNALISRDDVILVDTRNDYELKYGTFQGAIDPDIRSFSQFPDYIDEHLDPQTHRKVAMFCTGGIRCEKATAYLLAQGFEEVYHLEGGILRYFEEIAPEESLWDGECFVFDERVTVDKALRPRVNREEEDENK